MAVAGPDMAAAGLTALEQNQEEIRKSKSAANRRWEQGT
jgi:hypothetical protein